MKWLLSIPLLLGVAGVWANPVHDIKAGQTMIGIAKQHKQDWKALCKLNDLMPHCQIKAGKQLKLLGSEEVKASVVQAGEISYSIVGRAPLLNCGKKSREAVNDEAWSALGLSEEDKAYLRQHVSKGGPRKSITAEEGRVMIPTGTRIEQVTFCRDGKAVALGPMRTTWNEDSIPRPVYGERFVLPSGQTVLWMWECENWVTWPTPVKPKTPPPPPPARTASAPTPAVPASAPVIPPPPPAKVVVDKVASEYDWDAGLYVGGDRDVGFGGGEGAGYPLIRYYDWGRYALGGGGFFGGWRGGTPDGYHYSGENIAFGLAQKFSFANRRDLGIKFPMYGEMWTKGRDKSGSYQQRTHMSMLCAALSYTDASREKEGKTVLPEWQVWASFCDPFSQQKSHTRFGQTLDSSTIQDVKYVAGVGARAFLSKNLGDTGLAAKVQPFVEIGVNQTAPNPLSAHAYVGLRTVDKVWGCGVGIHHAETGNLPGATCTYDVGRDVKLRDQQERWSEMVKSLEALGVAVD